MSLSDDIKAKLAELLDDNKRFPRRWVYERYAPGAMRMVGQGLCAQLMSVGDREVFVKCLDHDADALRPVPTSRMSEVD